jgi:hypothetical protein
MHLLKGIGSSHTNAHVTHTNAHVNHFLFFIFTQIPNLPSVDTVITKNTIMKI